MTEPVLCVLPHRDDKEHQRSVGFLCNWHRGRLDTLTREVADDFVRTALIQEAGSAPKDSAPKTKHLKSISPPAPANLDVLVMRDARTSSVQLQHFLSDGKRADLSKPALSVPALVASWVLLLADERPLTTKLPSSVIGQLDLLRRHHDWIAAVGWVDDYFAELNDMRKALSSVLRDQSSRVVGNCHLDSGDDDGMPCGGRLIRRNGEDSVRCANDRSHSWVTAAELARLEIVISGARQTA